MPCGNSPRPARVRLPRAAGRLACCLLMTLQGLLVCALLFPWLGPAARQRQVRRFSKHMLRALGLALHTEGQACPGPVMIVSNHVSWLDILAINAVHTARFVSKADVRSWPLLGWMVACGGTLFIERAHKRDALRVVHQVADALRAGGVVAMFPEGTTGDGQRLLPFHANLLQAAIAANAPVQAIAVRYEDADDAISKAAAYVGEMSLLQSLWAVAGARRLQVKVALLPPMAGQAGAARRPLADALRRQIAEALGEARQPPR